MTEHQANGKKLAEMISRQFPQDGVNHTKLDEVKVFRQCRSTPRTPILCEPSLVISVQGSKAFYLEGTRFTLNPDSCLALCLPMAVETAVIDASEDEPLLGLRIHLDRHRLAKLILKIDAPNQQPQETAATNSSGIVQTPLSNTLFKVCERLLECLDNPVETSVLGESIVDEIYFRLLTGAQGMELTTLLRLTGQLQQIYKAVNHLQKNLHRIVSIDELAEVAHMSTSGFHRKFKEVMHLAPLQYIKLVRLNKAKSYIAEGKIMAEVAHAVGYNSPAQFSREYKRQFGTTPSDKPDRK